MKIPSLAKNLAAKYGIEPGSPAYLAMIELAILAQKNSDRRIKAIITQKDLKIAALVRLAQHEKWLNSEDRW
jgi:hypothetical protein